MFTDLSSTGQRVDSRSIENYIKKNFFFRKSYPTSLKVLKNRGSSPKLQSPLTQVVPHHGASNPIGLSGCEPTQTSKWRCEPLLRNPLSPTVPSICPRSTVSPIRTFKLEACL